QEASQGSWGSDPIGSGFLKDGGITALCARIELRSAFAMSKSGTVRLSRRFQSHCQPKRGVIMTISIAHLQPIVALIAGILILIIPRLLNIIVAVYLILIGLLGLGLFR